MMGLIAIVTVGLGTASEIGWETQTLDGSVDGWMDGGVRPLADHAMVLSLSLAIGIRFMGWDGWMGNGEWKKRHAIG